jgi:hypothetical protein
VNVVNLKKGRCFHDCLFNNSVKCLQGLEVLGGGLKEIWLLKLASDSEHFVKRVQHRIKVVSVLDGGMLVAHHLVLVADCQSPISVAHRLMVVMILGVFCHIELIILKP